MKLNWMDIVIIAVLLFGVLDGIYKGFIISIYNIVGTIIALIAAKYFSPVLAHFIVENTGIFDKLREIFLKRVATLNSGAMELLKIFNSKNMPIEDTLTTTFINIASFLCIFFIGAIILNILRDFIKFGVRKTPIKYIDKLGGGIIGFIKAALFVFIFFAILTPLVGVMPQNSKIVEGISTSKLAKYFFLYNFIIPWVQKMKL